LSSVHQHGFQYQGEEAIKIPRSYKLGIEQPPRPATNYQFVRQGAPMTTNTTPTPQFNSIQNPTSGEVSSKASHQVDHISSGQQLAHFFHSRSNHGLKHHKDVKVSKSSQNAGSRSLAAYSIQNKSSRHSSNLYTDRTHQL